jgi:hypothetical protein
LLFLQALPAKTAKTRQNMAGFAGQKAGKREHGKALGMSAAVTINIIERRNSERECALVEDERR